MALIIFVKLSNFLIKIKINLKLLPVLHKSLCNMHNRKINNMSGQGSSIVGPWFSAKGH